MALAGTVVFEVRTTGSDTNGGGFDPSVGSPGTDFSQQNAAQVAFTDLVIDAVTNTKLTSVLNPFSSTSPGNLINITGGAGFTTGWYEVLSVSGVTATMDRAVGTVGSVAGTGNLGGALASLGQFGALQVAGQTCYIKNGTYDLSASANVAGGKFNLTVNGSTTAPTILIGYNSTRTLTNTDTGPTLRPSANSVIVIDNNNGSLALIRNIIFNANSFTNCTACRNNNGQMIYDRLTANGGFSTAFANNFSHTYHFNCVANGSVTGYNLNQTDSCCINCVATACTAVGFDNNGSTGGRHIFCISYANVGTGFRSTVPHGIWAFCTSYNNSGSAGQGFNLNDTCLAINCLATANSKFGFTNGSGTKQWQARLYNCAGFNNTSGNTDSASYSTTINNFGFIALSGDPFNNAAGLDFSLNNTAGAGAAARGAGFPAAYPSLISTNAFYDIGGAQHQDTGGSTLIFPRPILVR